MLLWQPARQRYVFAYGDAITDMNGEWSFATKAGAQMAALNCGLVVHENGVVGAVGKGR